MSDPSAFIVGWLAIGLFSLAWLLIPTAKAEAGAGSPWHRNKSLRLITAMCLAVLGGALLITAIIVAPVVHRDGAYQYLIWGGWSIILGAEAVAISALGRISVTMALWALWGVFVIAWRGIV